MVRLPDGVRGMAGRGAAWAAWVDRLEGLAAGLLDEWELVEDGPARHGRGALALPVRTRGRRPAVLKVGFPDVESEHEHLALRHWNGRGAVQLLRADPHRRALLLERLHREDLNELWDLEACEIVAGLYQELHVPAPPRLRKLSTLTEGWTEELVRLPRNAPVPRRMVEQARAIARDFAGDAATDGLLLHTDLHYDTVLAADREPWVVIDPKPVSGDPHFEPAPMLWNRWEEAVGSGDVRDAVRRRFHALVDAAGLDEHRARNWVVLREVLNAVHELDEPVPDAGWITTSITVAKAVQD